MTKQNNREYIIDQVEQGSLTIAQGNVELVRTERFRLVRGSIPREVRAQLNAAVKRGELGHLKKDRLKPEAYFHPTFEYMAVAARNKAERDVTNALRRVAGFPGGEGVADA